MLRALGERGDIVKRVHRGLAEQRIERSVGDFVVDGGDSAPPIIGRLVARGLDDELKGTAYTVIDGVDGRAHHVHLADLDAASDAAPGGIVELRRFKDAAGRQRITLAVRSDLPLELQVQADGATRLDRQSVAREPSSLSSGGFGREVRDAMDARVDYLVNTRVSLGARANALSLPAISSTRSGDESSTQSHRGSLRARHCPVVGQRRARRSPASIADG